MSILPDQPSRLFKTEDRNKRSHTNNYPRTHPHCHARTIHATKPPATKETSTSQIQLLNVEHDMTGEAQLKQCSRVGNARLPVWRKVLLLKDIRLLILLLNLCFTRFR